MRASILVIFTLLCAHTKRTAGQQLYSGRFFVTVQNAGPRDLVYMFKSASLRGGSLTEVEFVKVPDSISRSYYAGMRRGESASVNLQSP